MTVLGRLLGGEGPRVLQTCRFEGLGGELYGREAIGEALKALTPGPAAIDVETGRLGVWLDARHALVADLAGGLVQRLWLLGKTVGLSPPPAVDLPADPDLAQAHGGVRFDPADHPELQAGDADGLLSSAADWPSSEVSAPRPAILRAASFGPVAVALLRLEGEAGQGPPRPVAFNALIVADADGGERRLDVAGRAQALARAWSPRL
ncbi:hypothetical protein [Brevundimonas aurifodinae]|uniref:Uncharacterized protein n=2 Tax=Brevundimonas TaxID=41275 RepID=A0ABV1NLE4_9CAUL|nr:MAG: hypothetical protein B7Z42_01205 [Brevundimonas sp. 12-68-7]OYX31599.1 MAG: hypothetical protein B7Z01_12385 [Brevundimonas subvibrioides]